MWLRVCRLEWHPSLDAITISFHSADISETVKLANDRPMALIYSPCYMLGFCFSAFFLFCGVSQCGSWTEHSRYQNQRIESFCWPMVFPVEFFFSLSLPLFVPSTVDISLGKCKRSDKLTPAVVIYISVEECHYSCSAAGGTPQLIQMIFIKETTIWIFRSF